MSRWVGSDGWKALGHGRRLGAYIVNYADDFVICCRDGADEALGVMREMMSRLKLAVNETKTHVCRVPEETFDFLGYTFGRCYSPRTGRAYMGARPSRKRIKRMLIGWANYFCLGPVSKARSAVDQHARDRLRQWLRRKHKMKGRGTAQYPDQYLHQTLGLVKLSERATSFLWART